MLEITFGEGGVVSRDASHGGKIFEVAQRIRGVVAVYQVGGSIFLWSVVGKTFPSKVSYLEHILIMELSKSCRFFRAQEIYSGDPPRWE